MAKRIILFTGKGGSGKTTCAAATALKAVEAGHKTLVVSSDAAHSLADVLGMELGPEPREVVDNMYAQEVDLFYSMKKYWSDLRDVMLLVFRSQGMKPVAAEELAAIPGMAEAAALLWLELHHREGKYDVIVVDSAPTGETLTFLTLPQATEWWITKAFPLQKLAIRTFGSGFRNVTGIPVDRAYEQLEDLFGRLGKISKLLSNHDVTTTRLVANPEHMVIQEARRAYTYLQLYGYGVDSIIVNRVLSREKSDGSGWEKYLEAQDKHLKEIHESFDPLPIISVSHMYEEVLGLTLLTEIGRQLYDGRNPVDIFHERQSYDLRREGDSYILSIYLPFLKERKFTANQHGDQLIIQVENQRRNYLLPDFLRFYRQQKSEASGEWLKVRFTPA